MKFEIDFKEPSTIRGLIWLAAAIIGIPMVLAGRDISQLLLLAAGIAGGLGVVMKG